MTCRFVLRISKIIEYFILELFLNSNDEGFGSNLNLGVNILPVRQDNAISVWRLSFFIIFVFIAQFVLTLAKVGVHNWIHNTLYDK